MSRGAWLLVLSLVGAAQPMEPRAELREPGRRLVQRADEVRATAVRGLQKSMAAQRVTVPVVPADLYDWLEPGHRVDLVVATARKGEPSRVYTALIDMELAGVDVSDDSSPTVTLLASRRQRRVLERLDPGTRIRLLLRPAQDPGFRPVGCDENAICCFGDRLPVRGVRPLRRGPVARSP